MSISRKIAGQSAFFLAGNIFTLVVGFALQVYLARQLGAEGLGIFGLLESGVGVVTTLLGLGVAQTGLRHIPAHLKREEYGMVHALVRKGFIILLLSGSTGFFLTAAAIPVISEQWPQLVTYRTEAVAMTLLIPLGMLLFFCTAVLRGFQDVRHIVIGSSFIQLSAKALLAVLLIWVGYSVLGYIWAAIIATLLALAWMLFGIQRHLARIPPDKHEFPGLLPEWKAYARVMYGNSMLDFWSKPLDRFVLGLLAGPAAVGVLIIVKMLYALPSVFLQMFLSIVAPMMASAHADDDMAEVQHIYHLCTDWLVRISLPLVIFLMVFSAPVLSQFGEHFAAEGTLLLQLLLVAQLINLLCGPIGNVLNMCSLEKEMFRISIISTIVGALILVGTVYLLGVIGVGVSLIFTVIYANFAALYTARKRLGFFWWDARFVRWILPAFLSACTALLLQDFATTPIQLVGALMGLYVLCHGAQWLIHGLNPEDHEIIRAIRNKIPGNRIAET